MTEQTEEKERGSQSAGTPCYAFYVNDQDGEIVSEYEHSYAGSRPGKWHKLKETDMVRIRHWRQETMESGRFVLTGLMKLEHARLLIDNHSVEQATLEADSELLFKLGN